MGVIAKLEPAFTLDREAPAKHQRLRKRARMLAGIFTVLFWLSTVASAALILGALFYHGHHVAFGPTGGIISFGDDPTLPSGYVWWADISLRYRLGGAFAGILQFVPAVMVLANLRGLFRLYARGIVFAEENARYFKRMGLWLIAYAVTPFLSVQLLILIDCAIDRAWFHNAEIYALGLGAILFVIAEVMEQGREIEQDRDGFV